MISSLFSDYLHPLPPLMIPPSPPSHNEVFVEVKTNSGRSETSYTFAEDLDTTKAQERLLSQKGRIQSVTQLCITHYWKEQKTIRSEKIAYKLDYLENPISLSSALAIMQQAQTNPLEAKHNRATRNSGLFLPHVTSNPSLNRTETSPKDIKSNSSCSTTSFPLSDSSHSSANSSRQKFSKESFFLSSITPPSKSIKQKTNYSLPCFSPNSTKKMSSSSLFTLSNSTFKPQSTETTPLESKDWNLKDLDKDTPS